MIIGEDWSAKAGMAYSTEKGEPIMGKIMTVEEVSEFLQVHPSTIYRLLKRHVIPACQRRLNPDPLQ
jgi:hypothetical protein